MQLALENRPDKGERVKIFNQMTESHQVGELANKVAALTGAKASVPAVDTEPEPDDTFAPEIIGQAGGINLKLQQGRHASVNGEMLLTADEVSSLIKAAIEDALGSVGAAIE